MELKWQVVYTLKLMAAGADSKLLCRFKLALEYLSLFKYPLVFLYHLPYDILWILTRLTLLSSLHLVPRTGYLKGR